MSATPALTDVASTEPPYFWGIDLGGTGIKVGLVDDRGRTLAYEWLPTCEPEGPERAVDRVAETIGQAERRLGVGSDVVRAGLGAPGPMDIPRGYLVAAPQLPHWCDFPIRETLSDALGCPVSFLNDGSAAAYGEYWLGSGKPDRSMVLLTLGTGVGGGIILEGELVHGTNSFGSECGHILVDSSDDAELCGWGGGRGQLEAYASASGVVGRTKRLLAEGRESRLQAFARATGADEGDFGDDGGRDASGADESGDAGPNGQPAEGEGGEDQRGEDQSWGEPLTAKRIYEAAEAGDALALEVIDETARWLGIGVTTIVHVVDPGSVVLGGAMNFGGSHSPIGRRFLSQVSEEFRRRTFENVFAGTKITFAELGGDAGYLGAAGYARKESGRV